MFDNRNPYHYKGMTGAIQRRKERNFKMTDQSNKRKYWGIVEHEEIRFTGTFSECWQKLVADFGNMTLAGIQGSGIAIKRIQ